MLQRAAWLREAVDRPEPELGSDTNGAARIKISIWATHLCLNRYRASGGGTGVELEIIEFRYLENVTILRLRSCVGGVGGAWWWKLLNIDLTESEPELT